MQIPSSRRFSCLSLLLASTLLTGSPLSAATLIWITPTDGGWFDPTNWDGGQVPSNVDTAIVNNGGVAVASGPSTPTAGALNLGAGGGTVSGTVTTTTNLDLSGSLQVGVASESEAVAEGTMMVGGDLGIVSSFGVFTDYKIGTASGENAKAEGAVTVEGDMVGPRGLVGWALEGKGASATGMLTVGGDMIGLTGVGVVQQTAENGVATGAVVVERGDLTPISPLFRVGVSSAAGAVASGAVTVENGAIRTTEGTWVVGFAEAGVATGQLTAAGVDSTGFPLSPISSLLVGRSSGAGVAEGALTLGTGDLRVGNASIGSIAGADGATARGVASLGGAMISNFDGTLSVGSAFGGSSQTQAGMATGALSAAGLTGFRVVQAGIASDANGFATEAEGVLTIGAGGIVYDGDFDRLRIGVAGTPVQNLSVTGPGPVARASATVGGDITGYDFIEIGVTQNAGTATGLLAVNGGTLTTEFLDIGRADPADPALTLVNATAAAIGAVAVTEGAVVVNDRFPGGPGFTRIGIVNASGQDLNATAEGALTLTRSTFDGGILQVGRGEGADGTLTAMDSTITVGVMEVSAQRGAGRVTLTDSDLTVKADPTRGLPGFLALSGRETVLMATDSDIMIDANLVVGRDSFQVSRARMAMTGGTLATGQNIFIGDFPGDSRGELNLTGATATVGGNLIVGRSANAGALFGEALLHLDGAFMDVADDLALIFGAELSFGVGGLSRGLGGYGALDATVANLFGAAKVDFAGLTGPLGFKTADFDLIAVTSGFVGDFSLVSLLNVPTGFSASHAFASAGSGDVWRVTLSRDVAPIPLPFSAWLLLSGLGGLGLLRGMGKLFK